MKGIFFQIYDINKKFITQHSNECLLEIYRLAEQDQIYPRNILQMAIDKLQLAGQNLGRVFNFRYGHVCTTCASNVTTKLPNLKWKTRLKQLLVSLPLAFALLEMADSDIFVRLHLVILSNLWFLIKEEEKKKIRRNCSITIQAPPS